MPNGKPGSRWGFVVLLCCALTAVCGAASADSYVDDFSEAMRGWAESKAYSLTQQDGVLTMSVDKATKWEGQYLHLGGEHDFSDSPYVNVKVKSDTPCILHVYLHDGENNSLHERKVRVVSGFVNLFYDFSDSEKLDLGGVQGMIFAVNGAANSWSGTLVLDDLKAGDAARKLASIEGVHDRTHYRDGGRRSVLLTGIENAAEIDASGPEGLLADLEAGAVEDGRAELSYQIVGGATGRGRVSVTAVGAEGYEDNSVSFAVTVEDNAPPTIDRPGPHTAPVGEPQRLRLTGLGDGNVAAEQELSITVDSSKPDVVSGADIAVEHAAGSPYATLEFTPRRAGTTDVTVTVDDGAGGESTTQTGFALEAVEEWNHAPTVDPVADRTVFTDAGETVVELTGIGDGDPDAEQPVEVSARTSDRSVVPTVSVDYDGGESAELRLRPNPESTGTSTVTVTVRDRGGNPRNNGDRAASISFDVTTRVRPKTGLRVGFDDLDVDRWRGETGIEPSAAKVGGTPALKIECRDKVTFGGLWFQPPDLDLSDYPYLTVDVRAEDQMQFNTYFYDGNERRNSGASQTTTVPAGEWKTVTFDFSGEGQMENNKGKPVKADWITGVLFNFHPKLDWPFTRYSGTLYLRNLRIGRAADVPRRAPTCTLDPVADRVHPRGAGEQKVPLSGVGNGADAAARVSVDSSGSGVVSELQVRGKSVAGSSPLTYRVGERTGATTVKVTVSAEGSRPVTRSFRVTVLEDDPEQAVEVTVDRTETHQRIYGFGTFSNDLPPELYAGELGASAMRVGLIANQIEPANDNWDPGVLHRGNLNYEAFDFAHYRRLKEAGVETFILSSWSPPAWMKANLSLNYQQAGFQGDSDRTANRLDYYRYEEFAEEMVAAVRMFQEEAGITLAAIGLQNEPAFHEPYPSAILDPQHFVELIKVVGRRFEREGIPTRLYMPEQVFSQTRSMHQYIDALNADPEAEKYCDVIATHGYDPTGRQGRSMDFPQWQSMWKRAQQGSLAKEMWMTETGFGYSDWGSALGTAITLYGALEHGNVGLWTTWSIRGQLVERGKPNPTFYACSQLYRHVRPGARRVGSHSSDPNVLVTSCVNDEEHGGNVVCLVINRTERAKAVRLKVNGGPAPERWAVSRTDRVRRHRSAGTVPAGELVLLPPRSVTTVAGR